MPGASATSRLSAQVGDAGPGHDASREAEEERSSVARALRGDAQAFGDLVGRYRSRMYQVAYGMVSHHETAMDLTQEAFLRAYQRLASFRGEAKFSTWLRRIVTNVCLDHLRKAEHRTVVASFDETRGEEDDPPDAPRLASGLEAPDRSVERKELGRAILEALRVLTPEQRAAIVLREVEGMSYEEIAKAMDCAVGTIMSRLHYARRRLRSLLTEYHDR